MKKKLLIFLFLALCTIEAKAQKIKIYVYIDLTPVYHGIHVFDDGRQNMNYSYGNDRQGWKLLSLPLASKGKNIKFKWKIMYKSNNQVINTSTFKLDNYKYDRIYIRWSSDIRKFRYSPNEFIHGGTSTILK